ncbi:hypothetical protein ACQ33O_07905 [Ferruginibacter sp. SUN002]|uniref:hypothetical protein n=1 Tax=Ferruginibacter sp. SUN002 TaxID=2937789 RepID=UPI003D365889
MQKIFTLILLILCLTSYGQKGEFNPFKLIVLQPDTAIIDKTLYADIDSVQSDYQTRYYNSIKQMEDLLNFKDYSKEMEQEFKVTQEKLQKEIPLAKAQEEEVKKFKYFQTISSYSTEVYNFYFNEYEPFSTIIELPNQSIDITSLNKLADSSKSDYVIFFSNIHTETNDGLPILKLTTSLYSKKSNKIIFTKETEGDLNSRGDMWTCSNTALSCLLINAVRTSTDEIAPVIAKAQIRQ